MPIERRDLERTLRSLGFSQDNREHRKFFLRKNGKTIAVTMTSYGSGYRTLSEDLVSTVARQIHVNRRFLHELVQGSKTREDYLNRLREQGLI